MSTYLYKDMNGNRLLNALKVDQKVTRVFGHNTPDGLLKITDLDYPEGEIVHKEDTTEYHGVRYHDDIVDEVKEMQPELDL